jgi:uncharacterized protein YjbJ (UPF0337 family)
MDWNRIEGNWKQFQGSVKEKWGRLADDDLDAINGRQEQLESKIQERYGLAKDQAKKDVDVASVFFQALALSGLLAVLPLSLLWFLERRERQTQWLFAAAFLWGGCIATALALPFNTAFLKLVDTWVVLHPVVREVLGPDAAILLAAPISAPIMEEIAKSMGLRSHLASRGSRRSRKSPDTMRARLILPS